MAYEAAEDMHDEDLVDHLYIIHDLDLTILDGDRDFLLELHRILHAPVIHHHKGS